MFKLLVELEILEKLAEKATGETREVILREIIRVQAEIAVESEELERSYEGS